MPDWIKDWALTELRELTRAKTAAGVLAVLAFGVGWWAASRYDADKFDLMQREIDALARGLAIVRPTAAPISPNATLIGALFALAVVCVAVGLSALRNRRLLHDVEGEKAAAIGLWETARKMYSVAEKEKNEANKILKDTRVDYAIDTLRRYGTLKIGLHSQEPTQPVVTIRYCSYPGDFELVKQIEVTLNHYVGWEVKLDGTNDPPLLPGKDKIVFDCGSVVAAYDNLIYRLNDASYFGFTIGKKNTNRNDNRLIIEVLPSG